MSWRSRAFQAASLFFGSTALSGCGHDPSANQSPTWFRDVQPIVSEHCASCHEPGGVAGVVLDFPADDAAAYDSGKAIFADAVSELADDEMPLWLADRSCRQYQHERTLSDAEKQIFQDFVNSGSQRGDPADAQPAYVPPPLSRVDATLTPSVAYLPVAAANGNTDTRCFVLDPTLSAATDVVGFDLSPGSQRVHHAALFSLQAAEAQALDQADAGLGFACVGVPAADAALVAEYVPGVPAQEYPTGTGVRLAQGSLLVLQILYDLSTGDAEPDQSKVELEYAPSPLAHPAHFEAISNDSFSVPPRASGFSAQAAFSVTEASTLWGIAPHLLSYGRQAQLTLTQPAGDACLVTVPNWDPSWEQSYFFADPASIALAPGDSIALTCTWDNPSEVAVVSGSGTNGDACIGYVYLSDD